MVSFFQSVEPQFKHTTTTIIKSYPTKLYQTIVFLTTTLLVLYFSCFCWRN